MTTYASSLVLPDLDKSSKTDISVNGYKFGDLVKWADPDNKCRWGICSGVITMGKEEENLGQFVVYWYHGCTRHFGHKGTESDPITRTHVKIAFAI